jgi:hypothetical protein
MVFHEQKKNVNFSKAANFCNKKVLTNFCKMLSFFKSEHLIKKQQMASVTSINFTKLFLFKENSVPWKILFGNLSFVLQRNQSE